MGQPKHLLQVGNATALERVVGAVRSEVNQVVVVVGAPEQEVPLLRGDVHFIRDQQPHQGPLSGLLTGLEAVCKDTEAVYLTGCDTPLLTTAFVRQVIDSLTDEDDAAAAYDGHVLQPLSAVYRTSVAESAKALFAEGERSLQALLRSLRVCLIPLEELRTVDRQLDSLRSMNTREEYLELMRRVTMLNEML